MATDDRTTPKGLRAYALPTIHQRARLSALQDRYFSVGFSLRVACVPQRVTNALLDNCELLDTFAVVWQGAPDEAEAALQRLEQQVAMIERLAVVAVHEHRILVEAELERRRAGRGTAR